MTFHDANSKTGSRSVTFGMSRAYELRTEPRASARGGTQSLPDGRGSVTGTAPAVTVQDGAAQVGGRRVAFDGLKLTVN